MIMGTRVVMLQVKEYAKSFDLLMLHQRVVCCRLAGIKEHTASHTTHESQDYTNL